MAHFARLSPNNVVEQVIVVDNKDTADASGVEKEYIGAAFCERLFGGRWIQTSYNAKFRKNYAGIGFTYDEAKDAFIPPKPYESWVLVEETCTWKAPIDMPQDRLDYVWDEKTLSWIL